MAETRNNFGTFADYRQTVAEIRDDLTTLKGYSNQLGLKNTAQSVEEMLQKSAADSFDVAVVGEFRRGKSTLINALLGEAILPSDVLPTTATLNRVTYGITPYVKIDYKDGASEDIAIEQLGEYVTKLTDEAEQRAETIRQATVYYPVRYCKNNVDIIDTPGLNDDKNMTEVTLSVLPQTDAALFVIMAQSPFSEYERDFLENKMLVSDIGRVIFVVTRIDGFDEEDADRVIANITSRIQKYVVEKAKKVLGEDSKEFAEYQRKLGNIRVVGVSAKQALKAKRTDDAALLAESRFPAFEAELEHLLTQERGAVTLNVQVNKILSVAAEVLKAIDMRIGALQMDAAEFNEKYEQAQVKITQLRQKRQQEFQKIEVASQRAYEEIRPQAESFWQDLANNAFDIIENADVSAEDIAKDNVQKTQERLVDAVRESTENLGQLLTEKMQNSISVALGDEVDRLQGFEDSFYQSVDQIHCQFSAYSADSASARDLVLSTAGDAFIMMGLGGVYQGFKQAGWKGALLGGVVGFGASYGSLVLMASLAMPITLPLAILAAFAGAIASRFAISKVFVNTDKQIAKFKDQMCAAFQQRFDEMRAERDILLQVREQIDAAFGALREKINTETENILKDTESMLADLQEKVTKNKVLAERETAELEQIAQGVGAITERGAQLNGAILAILNQ
nr:dynamin family protein [Maliibacterium massiliense]